MRTILIIAIYFFELGTGPAFANGSTLPENSNELTKVIQSQVPSGMPIDEAQKILEQLGFTCEPGRLINEFGPISNTSYLNCEHREMGTLHQGLIKRWQVAVAYIDGKVSSVQTAFNPVHTK